MPRIAAGVASAAADSQWQGSDVLFGLPIVMDTSREDVGVGHTVLPGPPIPGLRQPHPASTTHCMVPSIPQKG